MKKVILFFVLILSYQAGRSQTDTSFWFAAPEVADQIFSNDTMDRPIILRVTSFQQPATVTISQPANGGMPVQSFSMAPNTTHSVNLTQWIDSIECKPGNAIKNRGIKISSTTPVSAYYEVNTKQLSHNPEFYVMKGANALGYEFYISSQYILSNSIGTFSSFNIVATADTTTITITPTKDIAGHLANIPFSIILNKGQTYAAIATSELAANHLQGSHVTSDKPIAITLSDDALVGTIYGGCGDLAGDQTIPVDIAGMQYVAVRGDLNAPYDKLYVTATQNGTTVYQDGAIMTTINAGQSTELGITNASTYIQTSAPAYVYQLSGNGCEVGSALLPKLDCNGSKSVSVVRTSTEPFTVTLIVQNGGQSTFQVNNVSGIITGSLFNPVPATGGQYLETKVTFPLGSYPVGSVINIKNTSQLFQMGVLQGGSISGTGFGFFSNFNIPFANAHSPSQLTCPGGTIQLLADTVFTASYSWSGPNSYSSNAQNPTLTNLSTADTGIYTLSINIPGCGLFTDTISVHLKPQPTVSINASADTLCPGGLVTLSATGASSYSWSPAGGLSAATGTSVTGHPSTVTTYQVIGTAANTCTDTAQKTIVMYSPPNVTVSPANPSVCSGVGATLTASGASTYSWSPSATLSGSSGTSVTATPASTTVYTIIGTDGHGCKDTTTKTVNINQAPAPPTVSSPVVYCQNAPATALTATGTSLQWYSLSSGGSPLPGAPLPSTAVPDTTVWYVTQTTNGCESQKDSITVIVHALPAVSVSPANAAVCGGQSVTLTASGGTSYSWSPATGLTPTTGAVVTANPAVNTTYTVTATDANTCSDTAMVTVVISALPTITISPANATICSGDSLSLIATGAATYVWSPATGLNTTTNDTVVASPASTITYTITGTAANNCVNTATKTVTVNAIPVVTATSNSPVCAGQPIHLFATSDIAGSSFTWNGPSYNSTQQNPTITNAGSGQSGNYIATATANGCSSLPDTATVTVHNLPVVDAGTDAAICKSGSAQLQATGASSYNWTPTSSLSCNNCPNPIASPQNNTTYHVTGTDGNGCINTDSVTVNLYQQPTVNAGADQTICEGDTAQLQASGAVSYTWSPGNFLSCTSCGSPLASPPISVTFTAIGADTHGCTDSDQVTVHVTVKLPVSYGVDDTICKGGSVPLSATGGDRYAWSPAATLNDPSSATPVASPDVTTNYQVLISQGSCFTDTGHVLVTVLPDPTVNAGPDVSISPGDKTILVASSSSGNHYTWSPTAGLSCPECQSTEAAPLVTTTYVVMVSNGSCSSTDSVTVTVGCEESIFMPNTFSPNGDGINDRLFPQRKNNGPIALFQVFDRWGELLFEAKNIPPNNMVAGWDGTYKGRPMVSDVYVYIVEALCDTGKPIELKGDITLVR